MSKRKRRLGIRSAGEIREWYGRAQERRAARPRKRNPAPPVTRLTVRSRAVLKAMLAPLLDESRGPILARVWTGVDAETGARTIDICLTAESCPRSGGPDAEAARASQRFTTASASP